MTLKSAKAMAVQLNRVADALDDKKVWQPIVGAKAKELAAHAVRTESVKRGTLGDLSMSGWPRKKPAQILTRWEPVGNGIRITPTGRDAGNWSVLESGRKSYRAGQARFRGMRGETKNRGAVSRIAFTKRNVGAMPGKKTWSDATDLIKRITPRDITKAKVAAVRKAWR